MNRRYEHLPKSKRLELAALKFLDEGWTQQGAADEYGVSRPRVNVHVARIRDKRAAEAKKPKEDPSVAILAAAKNGTLNEARRVGTFGEFDERYFGRLVCPDCNKHHPTPDFHTEIIEAVESDEKRVLVNVPPYHAKSTLVTIKQSIHNLVKNPNSQRIIVSKSLPFARTFLHAIDQLLTNPELYADGPSLIDDWGPFKTDDKNQTWNKDQIYVAGRVTAEKDPTIQVLGVGGQIYGRRAQDIVFDDIADQGNQNTEDQVQKMREWIDKDALSRIGRNGKARWVGTRVKAGDIYSILKLRNGYKTISYSCILAEDDLGGETLWPDHFPYDAACTRREEMTEGDWQLIMQNVDMPGAGASFTEEMIDAVRDRTRLVGQYDPHWRQVIGLDLAGGSKASGYTAGMVKGVDLQTGIRYNIDCFNEKSMKAPRLKDELLHLADTYPIYELRVESNGLQSQIVQYNDELIRELAHRNVRVIPHITGSNKWDPQFGVEAGAPLFTAGLISIPWGNLQTAKKFEEYCSQLLQFPMGKTDLVMADWIAELSCKDLMKREHLPLFNEREHVPNRIKRKRLIVDFGANLIKRIPIEQQVSHRGATILSGSRRRTIGRIQPHNYQPPPEPDRARYVNVEGEVE